MTTIPVLLIGLPVAALIVAGLVARHRRRRAEREAEHRRRVVFARDEFRDSLVRQGASFDAATEAVNNFGANLQTFEAELMAMQPVESAPTRGSAADFISSAGVGVDSAENISHLAERVFGPGEGDFGGAGASGSWEAPAVESVPSYDPGPVESAPSYDSSSSYDGGTCDASPCDSGSSGGTD